VIGRKLFSEKTLQSPEAKNPKALERVALAKQRIQSILDRDVVAHQKTLEQKISDQGPKPMRVDPHLVGMAISDMLELRRLRAHTHEKTKNTPWYSNINTRQPFVDKKLSHLAPLYNQITANGFGNLIGDALELITEKCLAEVYSEKPRYSYQGHFDIDGSKDKNGRYKKSQPPKNVGQKTTVKEADFFQFGHEEGGLCIECKNYREWIYPHHEIIRSLIIKADDLDLIPVLIARRIHYTARTNLLEPAGIIAHETYYQYYPADSAKLAEDVKHKRSLGFTDVTATEDPHLRTRKFFNDSLFKVTPRMATTWRKNRSHLRSYADHKINIAQLYTEIGSPAGGKWQDFSGLPDGVWE
jgi:hypothetical protein